MSSNNSMTSAEYREYLRKQERAKLSKYKGQPTQTADGQKFRSHVEAAYYNRVRLLQIAGEVVNVEREVRYELHVNGYLICEYYLDFRVTWADGRVEHVDTKSEATLTPVYRLKKKLMKAIHDIDIMEVFK